jgi:hypothetical protein
MEVSQARELKKCNRNLIDPRPPVFWLARASRTRMEHPDPRYHHVCLHHLATVTDQHWLLLRIQCLQLARHNLDPLLLHDHNRLFDLPKIMGPAASSTKMVIGPMGIVDQHLLLLLYASNAYHLRFPAN